MAPSERDPTMRRSKKLEEHIKTARYSFALLAPKYGSRAQEADT